MKSKVEKLCQSFESDEGNVDLSDHHPNVIANVLKLYLRQVTIKLAILIFTLVKQRLYNGAVSVCRQRHHRDFAKFNTSPRLIIQMNGIKKQTFVSNRISICSFSNFILFHFYYAKTVTMFIDNRIVIIRWWTNVQENNIQPLLC